MIQSICVTGYKSLKGSQAKFAQFTVIVGRNNTGKSNLFDALRLLSHFAQMPIASAFRPEHHRGDPVESFFAENTCQLSIQCDLDLASTPHPFKPDKLLEHTLLHYEIEVRFDKGLLEVQAESLRSRPLKGGKARYFISTGKDRNEVLVNRDTAKSCRARHFPLPSPRSVLTTIDDAELYPTVVAVAQELASWRFFHFEPEALREPSPAMDIFELETSGRGLSGFYDTLAQKEDERFASAERALRRAIPEARKIEVLDTGDRRRLLAVVRDDGRRFAARVLSDGTLRFLALLALAYAPQPPGLICFEEPENGVHPGRLPFVVDTLRGIGERGQDGGAHSQVLVNSHSPYLVDLLDPEEMLIATLDSKGITHFQSVTSDLFTSKPQVKAMLETGEQTLGELWSQGALDETA